MTIFFKRGHALDEISRINIYERQNHSIANFSCGLTIHSSCYRALARWPYFTIILYYGIMAVPKKDHSIRGVGRNLID